MKNGRYLSTAKLGMPKTRAQQSAKLSSQSQEELTNNDHGESSTLIPVCAVNRSQLTRSSKQ